MNHPRITQISGTLTLKQPNQTHYLCPKTDLLSPCFPTAFWILVLKTGKWLLSSLSFFHVQSAIKVYILSLEAQNLKCWSRPVLNSTRQEPRPFNPCPSLSQKISPPIPLSTNSLIFQKHSSDGVSLPITHLSELPSNLPTPQPSGPSRMGHQLSLPGAPYSPTGEARGAGVVTPLHSHISWAPAHLHFHLCALAHAAYSIHMFFLTPWMEPLNHSTYSFCQETEPQRAGMTGI